MLKKTFNDRLTPEDKKEIRYWDEFLRNDNKKFANGNRRNRYHNLESLDKNISVDGRVTNFYEIIKSDSLNGEEVFLQNEMLDIIINYTKELEPNDQIIMVGKLFDKPMSSTKLARYTGLSDKTVTAHFNKHQKKLQQLLKDFA